MTRVSIHRIASGHDEGLFSCLHAPEVAGDRAVLLCNAFGQEAIRCHRIIRFMADRLAREGVAALRFDYSAAGDSSGDSDAASLAAWRRDILAAHVELVRLSGARRVAWIGYELGAALALDAAPSAPSDLALLGLWEPPERGQDFLQRLIDEHNSLLRVERYARVGPPLAPAAGAAFEVLGMPVSRAFRAEIEKVDAATLASAVSQPVVVLQSATAPDGGALRSVLQRGGRAGAWLSIESGIPWRSDEAINSAAIPLDILRPFLAEITTRL